VAVLATVRRLTKANVAVSIGVSSVPVGFDSGLDRAMKCGRLVRMAFWIVTTSVCTIEVMVDVSLCCLFGRIFVVVVVECIR